EGWVGGGVGVDERRRGRGAAARASWMYRHTRAGVNGISMTWVASPACRRASSIALAIAAIGPEMPDSPAPLAPSGLNGAGVHSCSIQKLGTSAAVGNV